MISSNILHLSCFKKRLNEIYLVSAIDGFATSLVGIFVPIYLLKLGFDIYSVLVFFAIEYAAIFVSVYFVAKMSTRIGLKHTMLVRAPFILIYLVSLFFLDRYKIPLEVIAIAHGVAISLYAIPMHSLFTRCSKEEHIGSEVGKMSSLGKVAGLVAPLVGGIVAAFLGFEYLFGIAIILVFISTIPLFMTAEVKPHVQFKFQDGLSVFKKYPKFFIGAFAESIGATTAALAWPIFVYLILRNTLSVGIIGTLVGLGTVFFALLIGDISDKINKKKIIKLGAIAMALIWIVRLFVHDAALIYFFTVLEGFFVIMIGIPFISIAYDLAKTNNIDEFIFFREIPIFFGRILILGLIFVAAGSLRISFIASSIAYLYFLIF